MNDLLHFDFESFFYFWEFGFRSENYYLCITF